MTVRAPQGLYDNEMAVAVGEAGPSRHVLSAHHILNVRMRQETARS